MFGIDKIYCDQNQKFRICDCDFKMRANVFLSNPDYDKVKSVYEFKARSIKGEIIQLENYHGYLCIFVNIATRSTLTEYNFTLLNSLYEIYYPYGLRILGFPCNQFNNEEPGDAFEIMRTAAKHNVKWDIFEKTDVNGPTACELFKFIKQKAPGVRVLGNSGMLLIKNSYTKFLINRAGLPFHRFPADADFNTIEQAILPFFEVDGPVRPIVEKPRKEIKDSDSEEEDSKNNPQP